MDKLFRINNWQKPGIVELWEFGEGAHHHHHITNYSKLEKHYHFIFFSCDKILMKIFTSKNCFIVYKQKFSHTCILKFLKPITLVWYHLIMSWLTSSVEAVLTAYYTYIVVTIWKIFNRPHQFYEGLSTFMWI